MADVIDQAKVITYREAVAEGIARELRRDPSVVCLGEDIGAAGGVFKTTAGLLAEFGKQRVWDTPISEQAILGVAMGAAMTGIARSQRSCSPTSSPAAGTTWPTRYRRCGT